MGIPHYLAMTAAELSRNPAPEHTAWLACRFSPYSGGISNLPPWLPEGSLLVLDDSTPVADHDPKTVARQLSEQMEALGCRGLLLDFQRPDCPQAAQMARYLAGQFSFPVGVSHLYCQDIPCPVFVPPGPLHCPLEDHLKPWQGREIWLETALGAEQMSLTQEGCSICPASEAAGEGFAEEMLHCHYAIETGEDAARFTLWRTREDLDNLLTQAQALGVSLAVGLWQELGD